MSPEDLVRLRTLAERAKPGYMLSPESEQANFDYICACDPATILSLLDAIRVMREALSTADSALYEAEAILGGEYGDHYGPLCDKMISLRKQIAAITPLPEGGQ